METDRDLPRDLTGEIDSVSPYPLTYGGLSDVFAGEWRSQFGDMKVNFFPIFMPVFDLSSFPGRYQSTSYRGSHGREAAEGMFSRTRQVLRC